MHNRPKNEPAAREHDYPTNIIRIAAYGAAFNGAMLGVSAGVAFNILQLVFRRSSSGPFRPINLATRPLALGAAFAAGGYVFSYTGNTALTFFVQRRADQQLRHMQDHKKDHDDFQISRVNQHN